MSGQVPGGAGRRGRGRGLMSARAAAFPATNNNRPDPIPGSHSTVGPDPSTLGTQPTPNLYDAQWNDIFGDTLQGSGITTPGTYFNRPGVFRPPARPVTPTPVPRPPMVARPPVVKPPPVRPLRPVKRPVRRQTGYTRSPARELRASNPFANIYGGAGFGGGGGAWSGAANDAFSASGSRPGMGTTAGPNPNAMDPDFGYWD